MRVLIVEDEYLIGDLIASAVMAASHHPIAIVPSAAKARCIFGTAAGDLLDLAFIDLQLRDGFTGLELASNLSDQGVICWFVTGNLEECRTHERYALGRIGKPFTEEQIISALELTEMHRTGKLPPVPDVDGVIIHRTGYPEESA